MSDLKVNKKKKGPQFKITNKGFYVALAVCLVAIGAACVSTYGSIKKYNSPTDAGSVISKESDSEKEANLNLNGILDIPENYQSSDTESEASSADETSSEASTDTESDTSSYTVSENYLYPVSQKIYKAFSGDKLVYSNTLKDWRVHSGVDFVAEKGTKVKPITTGTVKDIYNDDMLGTTVIIDHGNGIEAYYCGLGSTALVTVGQKISIGDYIGTINTVPCECADDSHLHLEIKKDGIIIDPLELLNKNR